MRGPGSRTAERRGLGVELALRGPRDVSSPTKRARLVGVAYVSLAAFSLGVGAYVGKSPFITTPTLPLGSFALVATSLGLGALLAVGTIAASRVLVRTWAWARALHETLRPAVKDVPTAQLVAMALASGLGEELFFRGLLVPAVGLGLSSLVFGALHQAPGRARFVWAIWAAVMGLAFGGLFVLTGSLAGPILAHVAINAANLVHLRDTDPSPKGRKLGGLLRA